MRLLALALVLAVMAGGCIHATPPSADMQAREVAAIEPAFPLLADLKVSQFEDTEVCRRLSYQRGTFTDQSDQSSRCADDEMAAIDDAALGDLERIDEALAGADLRVNYGYLSYKDGAVESATFHVSGGAFDRFTFYYERRGGPPDEWDTDTTVSAQVDANWWFVNDDWN
jgi:hypothetical protein